MARYDRRCSRSFHEHNSAQVEKTDKFEIAIRAVMQRIEATMQNPMPWPKMRYVCSEDADKSEQQYKVMTKEESDESQVD
jgi:hypothetical protein